VRTTDQGGLWREEVFGITVTDVDEIPPACTITRNDTNPTSASSVDFSVDFSESVTGFVQADVDLTGTASGKSITGFTGGPQNFTVTVSGIAGSGTAAIDVDASKCTDAAGNPNTAGASAGYTVDQTEPTIFSITSTNANDIYGQGTQIEVTLNFSEPVTLLGGDLIITLETGDTDREVTISTISSSDTVSGVYTVQAGDVSADLSVKTVALSGTTLRDAVGNDADLSVPSGQNLDDNKDIVVQTTCTITAGKTGDGTITPEGAVSVLHNGTTNFLIEVGIGRHIADIKTNGSHIAGSPYSDNAFTSTNFIWSNIVADGTIMANFATDEHTLTVVSAHGGTSPGTESADYNTSLSQYIVNSPITGVGTQYVCEGGSVASNTYTQVDATNVTLTITNDAALIWSWQTQYQLDTEAGANGSVDEQDQWVNSGSNVTVTATADDQYQFAGWSGNTQGDTNNPVMTVTLDQSRTITANFVFIPEDTDGDGLPDWWEEQYFSGATNANPNTICSNGVNTVRQAYIAGLNPTNPASLFLTSVLRSPPSVLHWNAVSGRVYSVWWTSNLLSGDFLPLGSNIPWTGNTFTDTTYNAEDKGFYKIDVELE